MTNQSSKVRLAHVASRQWGRVTWAQIEALGVPKSTVAAWLNQGYLHRRLPGVYAVGHSSGSIEADLAAALLYAGPERCSATPPPPGGGSSSTSPRAQST